VNTQFCKHTSVAGKRARMLPCQIRLTRMHTQQTSYYMHVKI